MGEVAAAYGLTAQRLTALFRSQAGLRMDRNGALLMACNGLAVQAPQNSMAAGTSTSQLALGGAVDAFRLHSFPGASRVIFLDFDGHRTSGTSWNAGYTANADIVSQPFDLDGNAASFSPDERAIITNIWKRVAEDYAPFTVDVTTEDPGVEALRRMNVGDTSFGIRVVISPSNWYDSGAGGTAYVGSFNWNSDTPCFIFTGQLANHEKYIAEASSHEVGHTLGLFHDGIGGASPSEYYFGHGDWAPIMGVGYYASVVQFSKGEYATATQTQDDLAVISTFVPLAADDHGNTLATATVIPGTVVATGGTIERATDADVFRFNVGAGTIALSITSPAPNPNLKVKAELLSAAGAVLQTSDPAGMSGAINYGAAAGTFYLRVSGIGSGTVDTGYSNYGSLGNYLILGTVPSTQSNLAPTAVATGVPLSGVAPLTVSFSGASSSDPENTIASYSWNFGDGGSSSLVSPSHIFSAPGNYTVSLTVTDGGGLTSNTGLTVTASALPVIAVPANLTVPATSGSGAVVTFTTSAMSWTGASVATTNVPASGATFPVGTTTVTTSATDAAGNTANKTFTVTVTVLSVPGAPSGVTAGGGNGRVDLSWGSVSGATSYTVKRGTTNGGPYAAVANGLTTTTYADTTVANGTTYYYVVSASNGGSEGPNSSQVNATPVGGAWASQDIGVVGIAGTTVQNGSQITMTGSGADIWGAEDGFRYMYRPLSGDGSITVKVLSVSSGTGEAWAKTGVMIREGLATNAAHASMYVTPGQGVSFQWRSATGGSSAYTSGTGQAPYWVRMTRTGNLFVAASSADGVTWRTEGSATIAMGASAYVGLPLTNHSNAGIATAAFDLVTITGLSTSAPPVITVPANQTVEGTSGSGAVVTFTTSAVSWTGAAVATTNMPASGAVFPLGTTTVTATATDSEGLTSTKTFAVAVVDTTPPVITVPANLTLPATSGSGAVVTYTTSAVDTVSGSRPTTNVPASGATFPVGTTTVTTSATDAAGNTANKTFTVTVTVLSVPGAPSGVTAGGGNGRVDLSWGSVSGATSYTVKRGTTNGGPYAAVANGLTTTTYADTTVANGTTYYYVVSASNGGSEGPNSSQVNATPVGGAWASQDIGVVGIAGTTVQNGSQITMTGSGADIWGAEDGFRYMYRPLSGDGSITVKVLSVSSGTGEAWAKTGVMIREGLATNAAHASMYVTPGQGVSFQWRSATGGSSAYTSGTGQAPYWVRMTRTGNLFVAASSADGVTWRTEGSATIAMGASAYVGLPLTNHDNAGVATATFDYLTVTGALPVVGAPSGVTAGGGNGRVDLSWGSVSGATSYTVKRGTTNGGPYAAVANGLTTTTYADTTVANGTTYYYVVSASNGGSEGPNSSQVNATPVGGAWASQDIGVVGIAGTTVQNGSQITMTGSGADIWGAEDGFRYMYRPLSGDGSITVKVLSVSSGTGEAWAKTGVMIREGLATNAAHASMYVTPGQGVSFQWRSATGGSSAYTSGTGQAPYWVRMTRTGNLFVAASSADGVTWRTEGSATIAMGASAYVGLPLTNHDNAGVATATFDYLTVTGALPVVGAPSGVTAGGGNGRVDLSWGSVSGATSYTVKRGTTNGGPYAAVANGLTTTTYADTTVANGTTYYYVVSASNGGSEGPNSSQVNATPVGGAWASQDIGVVGIAGTTVQNGSQITMTGSGADIWGAEDGFRYMYRPLSGDGSITVKVLSVSSGTGEAWAKTGVMIREGLATNAAHASMYVTPGQGVSFQWRSATGGSSAYTSGTGQAPYWVRMTRTGNLFVAASSADGVTWRTEGSATIAMGASAYVGLPLTNHSNAGIATAAFDLLTVN